MDGLGLMIGYVELVYGGGSGGFLVPPDVELVHELIRRYGRPENGCPICSVRCPALAELN